MVRESDSIRLSSGQADVLVGRSGDDTIAGTLSADRVNTFRAAIRRRLTAKGVTGGDLEDLTSTAVARFCFALRKSESGEGVAIDNHQAYSLRVADTVFEEHLRSAKPNWYRLKRRIVYLLDVRTSRGRLARWQVKPRWLGGFVRWHGSGFRVTPAYAALEENPRNFCVQALSQDEPSTVPLPLLLCVLFRAVNTPLEINTLTNHIADAQGLCEITMVSIDSAPPDCLDDAAPAFAVNQADIELYHGNQGRLASIPDFQTLLEPLRDLPVRQRRALLLSLSRDELLLMGGITELATTLDISSDDLQRLWPSLPLPDKVIAQDMQLAVKQVANLRKCARERLGRWLRRIEAEQTDVNRGRQP